jgi:Domain of unknown function (DUF4440)
MDKITDMTVEQDLTGLRALNARFIHNYITRDVASHDAITHARFVCLSSTGKYIEKPAYLAYWATAFDPDVVIYWDTRDERISIFGDTALVRATNKHILQQNGQDVTGMTAYTDTYVRENGIWLCIQAQLTSVAPDNYPNDSTVINRYIRGEKQKL